MQTFVSSLAKKKKDRYKCGKRAVNWVSWERIIEQLGPVGMGQEPSEAHLPLMGNFKSLLGRFCQAHLSLRQVTVLIQIKTNLAQFS